MKRKIRNAIGPSSNAIKAALIFLSFGTNRLYWVRWASQKHRKNHPMSNANLIGLKTKVCTNFPLSQPNYYLKTAISYKNNNTIAI